MFRREESVTKSGIMQVFHREVSITIGGIMLFQREGNRNKRWKHSTFRRDTSTSVTKGEIMQFFLWRGVSYKMWNYPVFFSREESITNGGIMQFFIDMGQLQNVE